jgi:hypothetical protein
MGILRTIAFASRGPANLIPNNPRREFLIAGRWQQAHGMFSANLGTLCASALSFSGMQSISDDQRDGREQRRRLYRSQRHSGQRVLEFHGSGS